MRRAIFFNDHLGPSSNDLLNGGQTARFEFEIGRIGLKQNAFASGESVKLNGIGGRFY